MKHNYLLLILFIGSFEVSAQTFYKGVDLSYANEMEDCGAVYYENGIAKDPFQILADHGANVVRVRLWHNPLAWPAHATSYSSFDDVKTTISRAKSLGLNVLLDFHYSDTWTDPGKQIIPSAWESSVNNTSTLETEMYNYTYQVLSDLNDLNLMPELVQVGNETNGNMLSPEGAELYPVAWSRQSAIINAGINAVRDAGNISSIQPQIVLHVADPNNGDWWFGEITSNGVNDFDIIGLSFYPEWHSGNVSQTGDIVENLKNTYGKEVMLVEVGVPWTEDWNDDATNMLGSMPKGYGKVKPSGQRDWLIDITTEVSNRGGMGVIYWEPAWISTGCDTEWGTGSHWENATFFDFNNELILDGGVQFLEQSYGSGNSAPTVNITDPSDGSVFSESIVITIAASASDVDGSVSEVEFFVNGSSIGTDTSEPYETDWTVSAGTYQLTAVSTDDAGASTTSSAVSVTGESATGGGETIHIGSVTTGTENAGGGNKRGTASITVLDDFGGPVSSAAVSGTFSGTFNESVSETTNADGVAVLKTGSTAKGGVTVDFCVENVSHSTLSYDPDQNVVTCSYDAGGRITSDMKVKKHSSVAIYPNPVRDYVYLSNSSCQIYQILDQSGKIRMSGTIEKGHPVDLSDLAPGLYMLKLGEEKGSSSVHKIIKK